MYKTPASGYKLQKEMKIIITRHLVRAHFKIGYEEGSYFEPFEMFRFLYPIINI